MGDHRVRVIINNSEVFLIESGATSKQKHCAQLSAPERSTLVPAHYKVEGIEAGYRELIGLIEKGGTAVSPAREARKTVQIMMGFLKSHQQGSRLVDVPE